MENARHLITGGCGLQGSHIVEKLLEHYPSSKIYVITRNPISQFPGVIYLKGDITSPDDLSRVFGDAQPDVVYHCAAGLTASRGDVPEPITYAINVEGTRYLLEESKRRGVKAFVFTSSASVVQVDHWKDLEGVDESLPTLTEGSGAFFYPYTKAEAERLVLAADDPVGMRTTSLRPAMVYGERDNELIPSSMRLLRAGRTNTQIGDNTNRVSCTYAGNSADAHLLAAEKLLSRTPSGVGKEVFFITDGGSIPFWDFGRTIFKAAGKEVPPKNIKVLSPGLALWMAWVMEWIAWVTGTTPLLNQKAVRYTTMSRWFSIEKARERLGYEPKVEWEEGIGRGVKWYLDNEQR